MGSEEEEKGKGRLYVGVEKRKDRCGKERKRGKERGGEGKREEERGSGEMKREEAQKGRREVSDGKRR